MSHVKTTRTARLTRTTTGWLTPLLALLLAGCLTLPDPPAADDDTGDDDTADDDTGDDDTGDDDTGDDDTGDDDTGDDDTADDDTGDDDTGPVDADGDGYTEDVDCDDKNDTVYPGAKELCDGLDNDCDKTIPAEEVDDDKDGQMVCEGDCDDTDPSVGDGFQEQCDGIDNDCDKKVDEDTGVDNDGDGYNPCDGDCNDKDATVYPGAKEICDGQDTDCDGITPADESDADGDKVLVCEGDCDDTDAIVHPGAAEGCDGIDTDCDGSPAADEADADLDGQMICEGDCDDADATVGDGFPELCDKLDNDCDKKVDEDTGVDSDGDGFNACEGDCDDTDPQVHPGAKEICDGEDNDCDGSLPLDEQDVDGDGQMACEGDCDDGDDTIGDGFPELCDGVDNDCSGAPDPDEVDADKDGFLACNECDDTNAAVFPGATEACDGLDTDCAGGPAANEADADSDGFMICEGDCDDGDADVHPGAKEVCDGVPDNNCDTVQDPDEIDDDQDGQTECDGDCDDTDADVGDGFKELCDGLDNDCSGTPQGNEVDADGDGQMVCEGDCLDSDPDVGDGFPELCDKKDNDCDGQIDEDTGVDGDKDGYNACAGDCDDTDATVYPGAKELCDGLDNDCNGSLPADEQDGDNDGQMVCEGDCDDSEPTVGQGFAEQCDGLDNDCQGGPQLDEVDVDKDGYLACAECDDGDPDVHPGMAELCDGVDTNCDGTELPDEGDFDGDGYLACDDDCDDYDEDTHPTAPELCDGVADNNCDGTDDPDEIDNDSDSQTECEGDCDDGDASIGLGFPELCDGLDTNCFGGPGPTEVDADKDGFMVCEDDCDDGNGLTYPGATEQCDGLDNDCDSSIPADEDDDDKDTYRVCDGDCDDHDGDTYPGADEICDGVLDNDCDNNDDPDEIDDDKDTYSECDGDCDDTEPTMFPGNPEICDGLDNNCDKTTPADEIDDDSDEYVECDPWVGNDPQITGGDDCDDTDADAYPGAPEIPNDGIDQDCDGSDLKGKKDGDGDGWTVTQGDCDDNDPTVYPGAFEVCDGVDTDCDGYVDPAETNDGDGDGWVECEDCDDTVASANNACDADQVAAVYIYSSDPEAKIMDAFWTGDWDGDGTNDLGFLQVGDNAAARIVSGTVTVGAHDIVDVAIASFLADGADNWQSAAVGDIDGNGALDIALGGGGDNLTTGHVYILYDQMLGEHTVAEAGVVITGRSSPYPDRMGGFVTLVDSDASTPGLDVLVNIIGDDIGGLTNPVLPIMYRQPTPPDSMLVSDADVYFIPDNSTAYSGYQHRVGDIDGDGDDEIFVGRWNFNNSGVWQADGYAGAYLIYDAQAPSGNFMLDTSDAILVSNNQCFSNVAGGCAGDVDGDDVDDMLLGIACENSSAGEVYLITGLPKGSSTPTAVAEATFTGDTGDTAYEVSEFPGDFNGDGTPDIVIGGYGSAANGKYSGVVRVFPGPASGAYTSADAVLTIHGATAYDYLDGPQFVGDLDGDGADDLVAVAFQASGQGGYAVVVFGGWTNDIDRDGWSVSQGDCDDHDPVVHPGAYEVCDGIDTDCDGYVDPAETTDDDKDGWVSCEDCDDSANSPSNTCDIDDVATVVLEGGGGSSLLARTFAPDDWTGDGLPDLGVIQSGTGANSKVIIVPGTITPGTYVAEDEAHTIVSGQGNDRFTSAATGDVDGNGTMDLVIGSPGVNTGDTGWTYIFFDNPTGILTVADADVVITGRSGDNIGRNTTLIDEDTSIPGLDLLVGLDGDGLGGLTYPGATLLYRVPTTASMDIYDADVTFLPEASIDYVWAANYVGDLDGDGNEDVLICGENIGNSGLWNSDGTGGSYLSYDSASLSGTVDLGTVDAKLLADDYGMTYAGPVGDVNGDGKGDFVVGAGPEDGDNGQVHLVTSTPTGTANYDAVASSIFTGTSAEKFYIVSKRAGDFNGDGRPDILGGAHSNDLNGNRAGAVYLFQGPFSGDYTTAEADMQLLGVAADDQLSWPNFMGDVNGDGVDDFMAHYSVGGGGPDSAAYLILGGWQNDGDGDGWPDGNGDCDDSDPAVHPGAYELCDGIDTNCDGYVDPDETNDGDKDGWVACEDCDDLTYSPANACPVDVVATVKLNGGGVDDKISGVFKVGDWDGDNIPDLGVIQSGDDCVLRIVPGSVSPGTHDIDTVAILSVTGQGEDTFESAAVGDIDGNGTLDIAIGGYGGSINTSGHAYIFFDAPTGTVSTSSADITITGNSGDRLGKNTLLIDEDPSVPGLDLMVGILADGVGGMTYPCATLLYRTPSSAQMTVADSDVLFLGEADIACSRFGQYGGDLDGDGDDEVVIGAENVGNSGLWNGDGHTGVYIFYDSTSLTGTIDVGSADSRILHTLEANNTPFCGSAGDQDGDGRDDLVVGEPGDASGNGMLHLITGAPLGNYDFYEIESALITGTGSELLSKPSMKPGDWNGDGQPDLMASASQNDTNGQNAGAVYVWANPVNGNLSPADAIFTILGEQADDVLQSPQFIGDVDGDGTDDVLMVAVNGPTPSRNFAYLVLGGW